MGYKIVAESNGDDIAELMGYDKWPRDVSLAFDHALGVISLKYIKNRENRTFTFDAVIADFRALEAEYAERLQDNAENARHARRRVTETLLQRAWDLDEPFETCQSFWHELQQLGFHRVERKINATWTFAEICREHGHTDLGLEVLDPVIAEVEQLRARPNLTKWAVEYYDQELESMRKLRARLEAERGEPGET